MMKKSKIKIIACIFVVWFGIMASLVFSLYYVAQIGGDSTINNQKNVVVVYPTFTKSAYSMDGFYKYYFGKCDSSCLTVPLSQKTDQPFYTGEYGFNQLVKLHYPYVNDKAVSIHPEMLKPYSTVILLHNEYVTQQEFDAITNHNNTIYLYPNSLYALVDYNQANQTIKLIRGHGYPQEITSHERNIPNAFNWKYDNTNVESNICNETNWAFVKIPNGWELNCYPEKIISTDHKLLQTIQELSK